MQYTICDSREPKTIQEQLKLKFPNMQVAALGESSGDFFAQLSNGIFIVERKCPDDFVASIADERLFEQSQTIPTLARFPFVVLDGEFQWSANNRMMVIRPRVGWTESGWSREAIEAAKIRIQANGMLFAETGALNYADRVAHLLRWCEEKADAGHGYHKSRLIVDPLHPRRQKMIDFLSSLPGVGFDRANNLVESRGEDTRLIELFIYALTFNPQDKQRPKLWGESTRKTLRELFELRPSERVKVEARSEWRELV